MESKTLEDEEMWAPMMRELRQAREAQGITRAELVGQLAERGGGVALSILSAWEVGQKVPTLQNFQVWAARFGRALVWVDAEGSVSALPPTPVEIAAWLRARREAQGWLQADLAEKMKVSKQYISRLERSEETARGWTLVTLCDWSQALGLTVRLAQLAEGEGGSI